MNLLSGGCELQGVSCTAGKLGLPEMAFRILHGSVSAALGGMSKYSKPDVITQVEKIRSQIQAFGESRVGCEELSLLCSDVTAAQEKIGIEQIAEYEGWTFQYLPDGHVRFSPVLAIRPERPLEA